MPKEIANFLLKLAVFSVVLCGIHYYIFINFFSDFELYFPLWSIYLFNAVLVFSVFTILYYKIGEGNKKGYHYFLVLMLIKMALAIVFLSPLFFGKSRHSKVEVINFFISYLFYLGFEIFSLNNFFNSKETK